MKVQLGPKITLPTVHGEYDVYYVFVEDGVNRSNNTGLKEGVALCKNITQDNILVRVQSSCLFSESFWATDCDCAQQLRTALDQVHQRGGVVIYFYEEGRGAGLQTKFAAIKLQQSKHMNTRRAYECLQVEYDTRSYEAAATVLKKLIGGKRVTLLSNNYHKLEGLKAGGINVVSREPLLCGLEREEVRRYLAEKRDILGHDIPKHIKG